MSNNKFKILEESYKINPKGLKSDYAKKTVASTRDLKRILVYLEEVTFSYYNDFKDNSVVICGKLKDALLFLTKYKLITEIKIYSRSYYCLPFKEKIAREILKLHKSEYDLIRKERKNENRLE